MLKDCSIDADSTQCIYSDFKSPALALKEHSGNSSKKFVIEMTMSAKYKFKIKQRNCIATLCAYLSLLASLSHSIRQRISPSRTGPFTFRMMDRFGSSRNSTRTCVTFPVFPVRPSTLFTLACFTCWSILSTQYSVSRLSQAVWLSPRTSGRSISAGHRIGRRKAEYRRKVVSAKNVRDD